MLYHCIESDVNTDSVSKPHSASGSSTNMLESPPTLSTLSDSNGLDLQLEKKGIKEYLTVIINSFTIRSNSPFVIHVHWIDLL